MASGPADARAMDEERYALDDGPCLTALREGRTVLVEDLAADSRWNRYLDAVKDLGVRSMLAVPIEAGESASAALNCYARQPSAFGPEAVAGIEWYAQSLSRSSRESAIALLAGAARTRKVRLPALALDIVRGAAIPSGSA